MNVDDYSNFCTVEGSRRVLESGIKLDSKCYWFCSCPPHCDEHWFIQSKDYDKHGYKEFPAYSVEELLNKVPDNVFVNGENWEIHFKRFPKVFVHGCEYIQKTSRGTETLISFERPNFADSLIDLLIWIEMNKIRISKNRPNLAILAEYSHTSWSNWMKYLFSKSIKNNDGTVTIPKQFVDRWTRQMDTPYSALPEKEKISDIKEAETIIALQTVTSFIEGK